jgi:hypothetical protein
MQRRDAIRFLAGTAALPLASQELLALGRRLRPARRRLRVLDPHQTETVATIAELIIPATDTPGARAAGVHEFVDLMLAEWFNTEERDRFIRGLADVDARAQAACGKTFVECAPTEQTHLLTILDQEVTQERQAQSEGLKLKGRDAAPQRHFFYVMKRLTLVGYYTSEVGATREVHYQVIPGRLDGCGPYVPGAN